MGDVAKTVPKFIKKNIVPIGFAAFDLDYHSSTTDALRIFEINNEKLLPRTFCYFDDLIGDDQEIYSQYTGELLAIREFNNQHKNKKLDLISGLAHKRPIKNTWWYDEVFILHVFDHKRYNNYTYPVKDRQIKLT